MKMCMRLIRQRTAEQHIMRCQLKNWQRLVAMKTAIPSHPSHRLNRLLKKIHQRKKRYRERNKRLQANVPSGESDRQLQTDSNAYRGGSPRCGSVEEQADHCEEVGA